jgi:hypothetical protein
MNMKHMRLARAFMAQLPPKACNMRTWQEISDAALEVFGYDDIPKYRAVFNFMKTKKWHCGTVACIGGWIEFYANRTAPVGVFSISAQQYLGIDSHAANLLFYDYPEDPAPFKTWKQWMLRRLDNIISDGEIRPWESQMDLPVR